MTPGQAAARAETARIYSGLTPEHNTAGKRLPRSATRSERQKLTRATAPRRRAYTPPNLTAQLRATIEQALTETGSVHAAMQATGCSYETVRAVWQAMNG